MASEVDGACGAIDVFDPDDSIGFLKLDDGTRVAFGATACKGFLPAIGARIRVVEAKPHPRHGFKAKRVELLDSEADHHARTKSAYGLKQPSVAEKRSTASLLGWVTVLLDEPFPSTEAEQNALAQRLGLADVRFVKTPQGDLGIAVGDTSIQAYAVPEPIDERRVDRAIVGRDFTLGNASITLSLGMADVARGVREMNPNAAPRVGALARVVAGLCRLGPGVVLDLAEGLAITRDDFLRRSAETEHPDRIWTAKTAGHDQLYMRSRGMAYLGAPDVAMAVQGGDLNTSAALIGGVCRDLSGGWQPEAGETISYQLGDQSYAFRMFELGAGWWLLGEQPNEAQAAHHASMWLGAADRLKMRRVGYVAGMENNAPPHYVDVYSGRGTAMITNGLALADQPGGTPEEGNDRVEMLICLDRDGTVHANLLSMLGGMMFDQDGSYPLRPWDGLRNGPDSGYPPELSCFLLVPRPKLTIWTGHETNIMQVVAVSPTEYDQLRGNPEAGQRWLEERKRAADWQTYHQRFNALLQS
jgi:hypothetical protein